jgi:hypothetical protein
MIIEEVPMYKNQQFTIIIIYILIFVIYIQSLFV